MKLHNRIILLCCLIFIRFGFGQDHDAKIDDYFNKKMKKAQVVGMQLGYIKMDRTTWTGSYGKQNMKTDERINDSTLFMVASCSKPVTALAILKLYNDRKLDLDTNINQYLPFEIYNPYYPKDAITIRMLLAHTSSLKDNWEVLDPLYTIKSGGDSPI